ncbi:MULTISPECIES: hypothetical protein [Lysobacter]|uniref:Uncharacterized protein n=1 Tax=Lysobacter firmicutimachus TaxID=1792846 RepID=A0ABU8D172_9GAMM|nr:hypothetical protein [Lysobacter antibioticus]
MVSRKVGMDRRLETFTREAPNHDGWLIRASRRICGDGEKVIFWLFVSSVSLIFWKLMGGVATMWAKSQCCSAFETPVALLDRTLSHKSI